MSKELVCQPELGYSGYRYFPQELHPSLSSTGEKQIAKPTRYEQYEGLEYILVREGQGTLVVNGIRHALRPGCGATFMSFDFHRFVPNPDTPMVIDYFRVSTGTYLYALASPYQASVSFNVFQLRFPVIQFEGDELEDILRLFDSIQHPAESTPGIEMFYALEAMEKYNRGVSLKSD